MKHARRQVAALVVLFVATAASSCSSGPRGSEMTGDGTGGASGTGGALGSGGTLGSGGALGTGGGAVGTGGGSGAGGAGVGGGLAAPPTDLPPLHVDGALIKDPGGNTIVLRGVALIDIGTLFGYTQQSATGITNRIDKILAAGLVPHVIRMPVYPRTVTNSGTSTYSPVPFPVGPAAPSGNHLALTEDEYLNNVLKPAVDYATQKGLYVIIDYHQIDNSSGQSGTDATTFWQYMAAQFANYPNVIYEPYNEPIDSTTTWANFKARAQGWVDTIRAAAPDNLIIVPSMSWDQHPGDAASSPLDGTNLVYTAHVYPGNWSTAFKQQVATAVTKVPVFISEWGYILNGTDKNLGTADATWGPTFQALVDGNGASWTGWVTDNSWTPNMFTTSALTTLTDFGTLVKTWLTAQAANDWIQ
jgi:endoglucanase